MNLCWRYFRKKSRWFLKWERIWRGSNFKNRNRKWAKKYNHGREWNDILSGMRMGPRGYTDRVAQECYFQCLILQCPEIGSLSNVFQSGNHFPQITNKLVSKKHCQVQALESASLNGLCQCILVYPTSLCQLHCWLDTDG